MTERKQRRILRRGDRIADFVVSRLLGQGGFGDIYLVDSRLEENRQYAMKLESVGAKRNALLNERRVLKQLQGSAHFPKYVDSGQTMIFRYLIMEYLGPSLSEMRRVLPGRKFTLSTSLRVGIETLRAIQAFHAKGFLHRDVKPSNFLLRPSSSAPICMIDYGLAKRWLDRVSGKLIAARERSGFVGTTKYASLNAHEGKDLGRRDDMWSWFFSLLELMAGSLPWVSSRDKQETYESKLRADILEFCNSKSLPKQIISIWQILKSSKFEDEPQYELIISFLVEAMNENNITWDDKYDWEGLTGEDLEKIGCTMPLDLSHRDHPHLPKHLPPPIVPKDTTASSESISESYEAGSLSDEPAPRESFPTLSRSGSRRFSDSEHSVSSRHDVVARRRPLRNAPPPINRQSKPEIRVMQQRTDMCAVQ